MNRLPGPALAAALLMAAAPTAAEERLEAAVQTEEAAVEDARRSQERIDALSEESRLLLQEFRGVSRRADTLEAYNAQLERLVASQEREKQGLERQIEQIEVTRREIVPLMLRMVDTLERFVELDLPFLPDERGQRIEELRALMDRADVTLAEKYRRLMQAYQTEVEYGRTIEAYRGDLGEQGRTVQFLRLGRVALYYQSLDGKETGYFDADQGAWQGLPETYRLPVKRGLRIARKQAAPELLRLPVPAPEKAE
mgnify:CR=1 FL=1